MNNILHSRAMGVMRIACSAVVKPSAAKAGFVALAGLLWFGVLENPAAAGTHYVATNALHQSPFDNWVIAASNIQDAISASTANDTVLVSNGVYETGGTNSPTGLTNWPAGTVLTNRVAITNTIIVRSANNDPTKTIIKGAWDPTTNGPAAVRCVYMVNNSSLIGFMLTNGATLATGVANDKYGGGVYCQSTNMIISNCVIAGNSAKMYGGGAYQGTLYNCILSSNQVGTYGGGTYIATLYNCTLSGNSAGPSGCGGGGAYGGTLYNCMLTNNSTPERGGGANASALFNCTLISNYAGWYGGGALGSTLSNCTLRGNRGASSGGGTEASFLYNCTLSGNLAGNIGGGGVNNGTQYNCTIVNNLVTDYRGNGGGARNASLYNCMLLSNSAPYGGGACGGTLYNCTLANNSASVSGGGVSSNSLMFNSIVYFNAAPVGSNWNESDATPVTFTNSCTAPAHAGVGNITANPMFVNTNTANYRLSAYSPCINTGTNYSWMTDPADVRSKDLDGRTRIRYGTVDMGAYEIIYGGTVFSGR